MYERTLRGCSIEAQKALNRLDSELKSKGLHVRLELGFCRLNMGDLSKPITELKYEK